MKLWAGRFQKETDTLVNDFNSSIQFDARLYKQDIAGSIAHAQMLGKQGIIEEHEVEAIVDGLKAILVFCGIAFFLCKMHNLIPFYGWKTPLPRCCNGSMAVFGFFIPIYKENPPSAIVPRCQKEGFLTFSSAVRPGRPAG